MTSQAQPDGASYIQLYSQEDPKDDNRIQWEVKQAAMIQKDAKSDRPWKYRASAFKFADAAGLQEFDLRDRFEAAEQATADAQADADSNAAAVAAESAARQQADAANQASIQAANTARGQLQSALEAADAAMDAAYKAADASLDAKVD